MNTLLEVKNLHVSYSSDKEKVCAVNGVDFALDKGECLGLVGETGAGKTTIALSIMGLLPERTGHINNGEIIFEGRNLLALDKKSMQEVRGKKIAMIFQDPMTSLDPVLTVGNQVLESLELHNTEKLSKNQLMERVKSLLKMVNIPPSRINEYPHQFSGGMKQRVVIAMALACNPQLLIADEPTTALDVTIQAQVMEMIGELQAKLKMTMILITHDLGIVAERCNKVATVYAGEIVEYGTVEEVFQSSVKFPYTEGLFNALPINSDKNRRLRSISGLMPDPTALPQGCKFHPRCAKCMEICRTHEPSLINVGGSHVIKCHLFA